MRENHEQLVALGAVIIAVAPHTPDETGAFVTKQGGFPFLILSDADHEIFDLYDVKSKLTSLGQRPAMFVIDASGLITHNSVGSQQYNLPSIDEIATIVSTARA